MLFHRTRIKHKVHEDRAHICGRNLVVKVNNNKFLEVIIDSKLNWSDHITCIKNKISKIHWNTNQNKKIPKYKIIEKTVLLICLCIYLTYCIEV